MSQGGQREYIHIGIELNLQVRDSKPFRRHRATPSSDGRLERLLPCFTAVASNERAAAKGRILSPRQFKVDADARCHESALSMGSAGPKRDLLGSSQTIGLLMRAH